jgi:c-di-GMP-binding flagellar brake protein YcgR
VVAQIRANLILHSFEDAAPVRAVLHDISLQGAGLFHHQALALQQSVILQLPAATDRPINLHARVVASRLVEADRYRISLQFDAQQPGALDRLREMLFL